MTTKGNLCTGLEPGLVIRVGLHWTKEPRSLLSIVCKPIPFQEHTCGKAVSDDEEAPERLISEVTNPSLKVNLVSAFPCLL